MANLRGRAKRTKIQREGDLVQIAKMYLRGASAIEIMRWLNMNRPYHLHVTSVQRDIQLIINRWRELYISDMDKAKQQELAHLAQLEGEYWEAWERSKSKEEEVHSEKIVDTNTGEGNTAQHTWGRERIKKLTKNRDGSPDFLTGIQWCIEQRMKILGIGTPMSRQEISVSWRQEAERYGINPDALHSDLVKQFINAAEGKKEE